MAVTINITSPNLAVVYLPIQIMAGNGTISVEGHIVPTLGEELNEHPRRVTNAWDLALDVKVDRDSHAPLDFLVDRLPSAPGRRTVRVKTQLTVGGPQTKDFPFLAMPRRLRLDLTTIAFTGGTCANCANAKRVFYLENDSTLAFETNNGGFLSKTEVWTQKIHPKICKCNSMRLEVTVTQGQANGSVALWIKPTLTAPVDQRLIRYENTAWPYTFPIQMTVEPPAGAPAGCVGWLTPIALHPA
jgi:hypothetical protein